MAYIYINDVWQKNDTIILGQKWQNQQFDFPYRHTLCARVVKPIRQQFSFFSPNTWWFIWLMLLEIVLINWFVIYIYVYRDLQKSVSFLFSNVSISSAISSMNRGAYTSFSPVIDAGTATSKATVFMNFSAFRMANFTRWSHSDSSDLEIIITKIN